MIIMKDYVCKHPKNILISELANNNCRSPTVVNNFPRFNAYFVVFRKLLLVNSKQSTCLLNIHCLSKMTSKLVPLFTFCCNNFK